MNKKIRASVFARAKGICECGCGRPLGESGHLDHFFGRAKASESIETCWAIRLDCDERKTRNEPTGIYWCRRFYAHARKHGYRDQMERVETKGRVLIAKGFT